MRLESKFLDDAAAIKAFEKKFKSKTKQSWADYHAKKDTSVGHWNYQPFDINPEHLQDTYAREEKLRQAFILTKMEKEGGGDANSAAHLVHKRKSPEHLQEMTRRELQDLAKATGCCPANKPSATIIKALQQPRKKATKDNIHGTKKTKFHDESGVSAFLK
jgi:hypothetical protein